MNLALCNNSNLCAEVPSDQVPQPQPFLVNPALSVQAMVDPVVRKYYPSLLNAFHASLAVFGAMALAKRTKPLSLIFEGPSGHGKSATLNPAFPLSATSELNRYVYRSDKFTPPAFVTHAANISKEELDSNDLLPKLHNKVLITKELAPLLRGRKDDLQKNFSILIAVLDGKGLITDSGMRGRRGYEGPHIFNWLGATTPVPASTHRMMSQLGTRLLFFEIRVAQPTHEDLLAYVMGNTARDAETECQAAVNAFLTDFFGKYPVGSVDPDSVPIPAPLASDLLNWALLLVKGRAPINFDENTGEPVSAAPAEGPHRVIDYFKELAQGHALTHGRAEVTQDDLALVAEVALSSIPGHLRPIVRALRTAAEVDSTAAAGLCDVTVPTARQYLAELGLLGLGKLAKGSPQTNEPHRLTLAQPFRWLRVHQP